MDPGLTQKIKALAAQNGVPASFAWALIRAESGGSHYRGGKVITSPAGAVGLMQLMPATARGLGVDPYNEAQNLEGGMRMLGKAWKTYNGNQDLVAASYNAGGGAVAKYGGVPPYAETRAYIKRIRQYQKDFGGGGAQSPPAPTVTPGEVTVTDIPTAPLEAASAGPSPVQPYMDAIADLGGFKPFQLPERMAAPLSSSIQVRTQQPDTVVPGDAVPSKPAAGSGVEAWAANAKGPWAGSQSVATRFRDLAMTLGVGVMSEKRDRQHTSSGGVSDHWTGSKGSYAFDLSNGSAPTKEMDKLAAQIGGLLGTPGWKGGVLSKTVGQYRIQVLYRTMVGGNHFNHVHVGVRHI